MMNPSFLESLRAGDVLIADGATGTNLQTEGLPPGIPADAWIFDAPEKIMALHRAFLDAGSDLILTCSFGGNRLRLQDAHYAGRAPELNRRAAELARRAVAEAGRPAFVAGSIGPTGQLLEPLGPLVPADVTAAFAEQAAALTEGGADLLVLETFYDLEEAQAAVEGVRHASSLPLVCSFSYDRGGRTMMGVAPARMAERIGPLGVVALGANCGTTLDDMAQVVRELSTAGAGLPVWAKPNAGLPEGDPLRYPVEPEEMAAYARRYVEAGAQVVGGCCGSTPAHVRAIAEAVRG